MSYWAILSFGLLFFTLLYLDRKAQFWNISICSCYNLDSVLLSVFYIVWTYFFLSLPSYTCRHVMGARFKRLFCWFVEIFHWNYPGRPYISIHRKRSSHNHFSIFKMKKDIKMVPKADIFSLFKNCFNPMLE